MVDKDILNCPDLSMFDTGTDVLELCNCLNGLESGDVSGDEWRLER